MKDFPVFDTEYGIASLVLREIPYKEEAYILLREVWDPEPLLKECVSFCRMAGAEKIFATGHAVLEQYPYHTTMLLMRGEAKVDGELLESLFPVTEETVGRWREIHNEKMRPVPNSAILAAADEKKILSSGGAYFVHREGQLLGIGWLEEPEMRVIASVQPGAGQRVLNTLMSLVEGSQMELTVASTNERAVRLYEKMGFLKVKEISRWYRVWPETENWNKGTEKGKKR